MLVVYTSVPEVAHPRKNHRQPTFVGSDDQIFI
jgi:hypothetical protein